MINHGIAITNIEYDNAIVHSIFIFFLNIFQVMEAAKIWYETFVIGMYCDPNNGSANRIQRGVHLCEKVRISWTGMEKKNVILEYLSKLRILLVVFLKLPLIWIVKYVFM